VAAKDKHEGNAMGTQAERLAERFAVANAALLAVAQRCTDQQWQARCAAEGWSVGVVVHHVATDYLDVLAVITALATGASLPMVSREQLDERNARQPEHGASRSQAETLALLERNSARVVESVRRLSDAQLARTGPVLGHERSVAQFIAVVLSGHIEGHLASIRATVSA